jgi:hypothetical protein
MKLKKYWYRVYIVERSSNRSQLVATVRSETVARRVTKFYRDLNYHVFFERS